jgi:hypothetical protein
MGKELRWAPEPVWAILKREISLALLVNRIYEHVSQLIYRRTITYYAHDERTEKRFYFEEKLLMPCVLPKRFQLSVDSNLSPWDISFKC